MVVDPAVCVAVARERLVRCEGWRERYVGFVLLCRYMKTLHEEKKICLIIY